MSDLLTEVLNAFSEIYSGWIVWNLFLAFIPLVLSFWLFRRQTGSRSWLWWLAFIIFIAFLPNAPYLLTDIIHLIRGTREGYSAWIISLIFLPVHVIAILVGFEAYVISLLNQAIYLKRQGARQFILPSELMMHGLCALGIFLGRLQRLNSWDLVTDPGEVIVATFENLTSKRPLLAIAIIFVVVATFYWLIKQITLGLILRIRYAREGKDVLE